MGRSCRCVLCAVAPTSLACALASLHLHDRSSAKSWLVQVRPGYVFTPKLLPASVLVLHPSAPVRMGAVADPRLGLA